MAMLQIHHILRIRVLEDSAECGVFVVNIYCGEPLLLRFWCVKPAFRNGQVEQMDANAQTATQMDFVLRVTHRAPGLPNSHYWGPFVLSLCLDALRFRFRLPTQAQSGREIQEIMEECGELMLLRWKLSIMTWKSRSSKAFTHRKCDFLFCLLWLDGWCSDSPLGFDCIHTTSSALFFGRICGLARPLKPVHPPWPAMYVRPETNCHNITGLTTHTIVGRAWGALWWARHTITQCGEDERAAAGTGKLHEDSSGYKVYVRGEKEEGIAGGSRRQHGTLLPSS